MTEFPALPPLFPDVHMQEITEYFKSLPNAEPEFQSSNLESAKLRAAYFLCFTNRCGSNYIAQSISSDGRLAQAGESINFDTVIKRSRQFGFASFREYFFWLARSSKRQANMLACKVSVGQLLFLYNEGLLGQFLSQPKFIHIVRKDTISQAVSLYIASKTNKWTSEQTGIDVPIDYDKDALISIVRSICFQNAAFESVFQLFGVSPLVVSFEDFVESPHDWVKKIGDFLGVDNLAYVSNAIRYSKQADQKNDELISRLRQEFKL